MQEQQKFCMELPPPPRQEQQQQQQKTDAYVSKLLPNERMKYARKCRENKQINEQKNNATRTISLMKHRIDVLEKEKLELKKVLNELFKENENICNLLCRIEKEEQYGPPTLDEVIIEDLLKNMHISKYRRTYSSTLLSICFILLSYSPITYRKLTELLPFPSEKNNQGEVQI